VAIVVTPFLSLLSQIGITRWPPLRQHLLEARHGSAKYTTSVDVTGLAADRQRSATGEARFPYGVRRRST